MSRYPDQRDQRGGPPYPPTSSSPPYHPQQQPHSSQPSHPSHQVPFYQSPHAAQSAAYYPSVQGPGGAGREYQGTLNDVRREGREYHPPHYPTQQPPSGPKYAVPVPGPHPGPHSGRDYEYSNNTTPAMSHIEYNPFNQPRVLPHDRDPYDLPHDPRDVHRDSYDNQRDPHDNYDGLGTLRETYPPQNRDYYDNRSPYTPLPTSSSHYNTARSGGAASGYSGMTGTSGSIGVSSTPYQHPPSLVPHTPHSVPHSTSGPYSNVPLSAGPLVATGVGNGPQMGLTGPFKRSAPGSEVIGSIYGRVETAPRGLERDEERYGTTGRLVTTSSTSSHPHTNMTTPHQQPLSREDRSGSLRESREQRYGTVVSREERGGRYGSGGGVTRAHTSSSSSSSTHNTIDLSADRSNAIDLITPQSRSSERPVEQSETLDVQRALREKYLRKMGLLNNTTTTSNTSNDSITPTTSSTTTTSAPPSTKSTAPPTSMMGMLNNVAKNKGEAEVEKLPTIRVCQFNIDQLCARYSIRTSVLEELKSIFLQSQESGADGNKNKEAVPIHILASSDFSALQKNYTAGTNPYSGKKSIKIDDILDQLQSQRFTLSNFDLDLANPANKALAARILTDVNADVLCLSEVESLKVLDYFNTNYLPHLGYNQTFLVESRDRGASNVAILSRYPIVSTHSHKDAVTRSIFSKGCLEVDIMVSVPILEKMNIKSGKGRQLIFDQAAILTLYVVHFKRAGNHDFLRQVRREQSEMLKKIIEARWRQSSFQGNFMVVGDLNDAPGPDSSISSLLNAPYLENVVERLPTEARWTHFFQIPNKPSTSNYRQLDYILISPTLTHVNPKTKPVIVRSGLELTATGFIGKRYFSPAGGFRASDHCPLFMDVSLAPNAPYVSSQSSILKTALTPVTIHLLANNSRFIIYQERIPAWLPSLKYKPDCKELNEEQKKTLHGYFDQLRSNSNSLRVDASVDKAKPTTIDLLEEGDDGGVIGTPFSVNNNNNNNNDDDNNNNNNNDFNHDKKKSLNTSATTSSPVQIDISPPSSNHDNDDNDKENDNETNRKNDKKKTKGNLDDIDTTDKILKKDINNDKSGSNNNHVIGNEFYIDFDSDEERCPLLESIHEDTATNQASNGESNPPSSSLSKLSFDTDITTNDKGGKKLKKKKSLRGSLLPPSTLDLRAGMIEDVINISSSDDDDVVISNTMNGDDDLVGKLKPTDPQNRTSTNLQYTGVSDDDDDVFDSTAILPSLLSPHQIRMGTSGEARENESDSDIEIDERIDTDWNNKDNNNNNNGNNTVIIDNNNKNNNHNDDDDDDYSDSASYNSHNNNPNNKKDKRHKRNGTNNNNTPRGNERMVQLPPPTPPPTKK